MCGASKCDSATMLVVVVEGGMGSFISAVGGVGGGCARQVRR